MARLDLGKEHTDYILKGGRSVPEGKAIEAGDRCAIFTSYVFWSGVSIFI